MTDIKLYGSPDDIAIIGMSGRFPGARNIAEFWENLREGKESISFFSDEELKGIDPSLLNDPAYVKAGGVLEGVELFDAAFFGINPREAEVMDPQHRLFLQCAWEALEDAGYNAESYQGMVGVYAGTGMSSYLEQVQSSAALINLLGHFQILIWNDKDSLPTNVSYKMNFRGPSMAVQTACSSSLVSVSLACQSLQNYHCDMALAGGVRVTLPQEEGYFYQEGGILSPDGHCRAFDARSKGTVSGSGVGIVVLKRLANAIADGDCVRAIIKGSAINNDGSLKVGYTAPSVQGQAAVIAMAQAIAGVEPETVNYIEAHGTGTELGDPIEVTALTQAFRARTDRKNFCAIGSVKTNIGHLDTAAGVAGLIKTVLALEKRMIPSSLHFEQPNPKIDFANSPFYVNDKLSEWKSAGSPRRAGVSSFGIGGTNAHVILEEAPRVDRRIKSRPQHLLCLSARAKTPLEKATANLIQHLRQHPNIDLASVAYTLQVGRKAFTYRRVVVCSDVEDALSALESPDRGRVFTANCLPAERQVTFMFSGQGSQYAGMGSELYTAEPVFREQVDRCADFLNPHLGFDIRKVLFPDAEHIEEANQKIRQTAIAQPALFVIEYALAQLWMRWGVRPTAMIGHSIGEYVAACLAGVISLEDVLTLVAARGRLMQQMPEGAMMAVPLSEQGLRSFIDDGLCVAAINGPELCVISGPTESVNRLDRRLGEHGLKGVRLHTSHAFHSQMMDPIIAAFLEVVKRIEFHPPQIPYVSNLTGTWISGQQATDPTYWSRHLRQAVRFSQGLETIMSDRNSVLLEVGPGHTLASLARQHPQKDAEQAVLSSIPHANDAQSDERFLLNTLGRLWLAGVKVDWSGFYGDDRPSRVPLPTYPFEERRYWVEHRVRDQRAVDYDSAPAKRPDIAEWFYVPSWKRSAPPELIDRETPQPPRTRWLIFEDRCSIGAALARRLKQEDCDVVSVRAGDQFVAGDDGAYTIDPENQAHYLTLLEELRSTNRVPQVIVHLWSVTRDDQTESGIRFFEQYQNLGFYSLLFLAQAISELSLTDPIQIGVVANHVQSLTGEEKLCPEKATILGPCQVIPEEYPNVDCCNIDIVLPASGAQPNERLIEQLLEELKTGLPDPVVAYRGMHRWVRTFEELHLADTSRPPIRLREGGVHLITGGMGGIGLVLAEYLAQTVKAKLILVGRSPIPDQHEWASWLSTHDDNDSTSRKIVALQSLEQSGAEVMAVSADVADVEAMREVVTRAIARFGAIHGVIHSAGVAGGGVIQLKQREVAAGVLAPKLRGALVLDDLLKDAAPDFLVLCSSINAIDGAVGQVDYCGANAFLDSFAHYANLRGGGLAVSVNWDTWQEVGMAVNTAVPAHLEQWRAESLKLGMLPQEGVEAFKRILGTSLSQVVVSTTDLQATLRRRKAPAGSEDSEYFEEDNEEQEAHVRPALATPYVAPSNETEEKIVDIWQRLLGVQQIGIHDNFLELGGHSLLALQLVSRLRETFQTELTIRNVFESPTVAGIAAALEKDRQEAGDEIGKLENVLAMVEQLSSDEVEKLLAQTEHLLEG